MKKADVSTIVDINTGSSFKQVEKDKLSEARVSGVSPSPVTGRDSSLIQRYSTGKSNPPQQTDKYGSCTIPENTNEDTNQGLFPSAGEEPRCNRVKPKPSKLIRILKSILNSIPQPVHPPPFRFEATEEAARSNFQVLQAHDMNLDSVLNSAPFSPNSFGSEFRDTGTLEPLYGSHPSWPEMKSILESGSSFPSKELDEDKD